MRANKIQSIKVSTAQTKPFQSKVQSKHQSKTAGQLFAVSLLPLLISQHLYAETLESPSSDDMPHVTLDAIVVEADKTGLPLASRISEMPNLTQIFDAEQIATQTTANNQLADVLGQLVPSLGVSTGTTSNFGQTMRGRQVQYLINGVPLTGSRDISRQLNSINPNQIERIEVLSGATSIYGAGATGGLINIVTKSYVDDTPFQTRVGITANNNFDSEGFAYQVGQTLGVNKGDFSARLDVDYEQLGGSFDSHNDRIAPEPAQTDQQDTKSLSVNANIDWYIDDTQDINLAVTHYEDEQDTDYAPDYGKNLAVLFGQSPSLKAIDGLSLSDQPKNTKQTFNLNYHNEDVFDNALNLTAYHRVEEGSFYPFVVPFSVKKALPILQGMNLTEAELTKYSQALQQGAYGVLQSESDIKVSGARLALQKKLALQNHPTLLTYGLDYEREEDKQSAKGYDLATFMQSDGLSFTENGRSYTYGPDTTIESLGAFVNVDTHIIDNWKLTAGLRHQRIDSDIDGFTPPSEILLSDLLAQYKIPLAPKQVNAGSVKHSKTLFNLGTSYDINDNHQIFASFSQGYSLPDLQRVMRDVDAGFVVNSDNVEPISVNSYDIGWSGRFGDTTTNITGFYNTSDKVVQFQKDYSVTVADTDERVYGAQVEINHDIDDMWSAGGSVAYTRGQYKDANNEYNELGAFRITPLKGTAFTQYTSPDGYNVRLQMQAIGGTDRAYKDSLTAKNDANVRRTPEAKISGYVVTDVISQFELPKGKLDFGVYNLFNKEYKTVFSQSAEATYGPMSSLDATGRTYGIRYTIDY